MNLRSFSALLVILLLPAASSEARGARGSSGGDGGGGLSRERGLSQAESQAVGVVIGQAASASGGSAETPTIPQHHYSPDYYRVYHGRAPAAAPPKPAAAVAPAPTPIPTPKVMPVRAVTAAPKPTPPTPAPKPFVKRMFPSAPAPAAPLPPAQRTPIRVAVMPVDANGTIYLPVRGSAESKAPPLPKTKAAPAPLPNGMKPKRTLF